MIVVSRRAALGHLIGGLAFAAMPGFAAAAGPASLVVIRLRGALDGLGALAPHGDPDYREARAGLALGRPGESGGIVDLDGFFGLHPALPTLAALYRQGQAIVIPAAGTGYAGRSHRDGQAILDRGGCWSGIAACAPPAVETAAEDLASDLAARHPTLAARMLGTDDAVCSRAQVAARLRDAMARRKAEFVESAARVGRRIAAGHAGVLLVDSFGWDNHAEQGRARGRLADALATLDAGLATLVAETGPAWRRTVVLVVTEFGRSIAMNAAGGTDHGGASAAFVIGGRVDGGRILGPWPGLRGGPDLEATVDLGAIMAGLACDHLARPDAAASAAPLRGLLRG